MGKLTLLIAGIAVAGLVILGIVVAKTTRVPVGTPVSTISMSDSGQAMGRAGVVMQTHGQEMLDVGQRTGDQGLIDYGKRWIADGQEFMRGGQIMANSTVPTTEHPVSGAGLSLDNAVTLTNAAQQMLHDVSQGNTVDINALRWNGLAMQSEGQSMTIHARLMAQEIDWMTNPHSLNAQTATDLRQATQTLTDAGNRLTQNGQGMMDYANRLAPIGIERGEGACFRVPLPFSPIAIPMRPLAQQCGLPGGEQEVTEEIVPSKNPQLALSRDSIK